MDALSGSTFNEFIHYNNWSNQKVLEACRGLSDEQLDAEIPGAYGTIRSTLLHILWSEAFYLKLIIGSRPLPPFEQGDTPTLDQLAAYAAQVGPALVEMAQRTPPTAVVEEDLENEHLRYTALALFIQIIDHGIEHRTNITTVLNQGLLTPPEIDGWAYMDAFHDRFGFQATAKPGAA
jgi:uncharacterized damage-inducible protein DinB